MNARALAFVAVIGAAFVSGCTDEIAGCRDGGDSACPGGTVCAFGLCVDANDLAAVDVEIEPVASSGLPLQSVFDVDATENDGARIDIALKDGQSLDRRVTTANGAAVSASVLAVPQRSIPGRVRVPTTTTNDTGAFTLPLLSDAEYALTINPDDSAFPPLTITPVDASYDGSLVVDQEGFVTLRGRIVNGVGDAQDGLEVFVELVQPRDDGGSDRRRISTIVRSGPRPVTENCSDDVDNDGDDDVDCNDDDCRDSVDCSGDREADADACADNIDNDGDNIVDCDDSSCADFCGGTFALTLRDVSDEPAGFSGARLVIRPTADNALQPTVIVPVDAVTGDVDLGDLSLGAVSGTVTPVHGLVTSIEGPARGAVVSFQALVGAGVFSARVVAGDDGSFDVSLIPGSYSVGAVPDATARAGLFVLPEAFVVDPATGVDDLLIPLPSRDDASVRITTNDGIAVAAASVSFERVGDVFGLNEPVLDDAQPVFLSSTDNDGNAHVAVDAGRYRVSIQPPRGAGAPAFTTLITVDGPFTRDFTLPPQKILAGVVVDGDGAVAPGAFVRVFSKLKDERGRAIFLGEASCGVDGAFAVTVPDLTAP